MKPSHSVPQLVLVLVTVFSLAALSFAQVPTVGTANLPVNYIGVSDQKPGSVLVFPYYTSDSQTKADTRLTLTNLAQGNIGVHLFFLRGTDCQQADQFVCLTKGASISFKASEQDPETTGYLIAVAVDSMGRAISWNALIGNAFVNTSTIADNYGAESFTAHRPQNTVMDGIDPFDPNIHVLFFNGGLGGYDRAPYQFAVEIQSPLDAPEQTLVHVSMNGFLAAGTMGSIFQGGTGLLVRADEKQSSFVRFIGGNCQSINVISTTAPRVPSGMGTALPKGQTGTLVYRTALDNAGNPMGTVGLLMTPKNNAWSGIRTLHKTATTTSLVLIPITMPVCDIALPTGTIAGRPGPF